MVELMIKLHTCQLPKETTESILTNFCAKSLND